MPQALVLWEQLREQPGTLPAQLTVAEPMFCPLPAALLWVTELKRWPAWGRRAATKPGYWAKRDRTATRGRDKAGGSQGRAETVGVEVFNLACVSK